MSRAGKIVLVTGGAGYIGSVLVGELLSQGCNVRAIDNLVCGGSALLAYIRHPAFEFLYGDIRRAQDVERALEGVEAVVHLAAVVGDKACCQNERLAKEVNGAASQMLCEKAIACKVKRFLFASTCSNYGATDTGCSRSVSAAEGANPGGVDETSPLNPLSLYAELKVSFERFLLRVAQDNFTPVCLRFATAYGLSGRPRFDLTVNEFTRDLLSGRRLEVYGEQSWRPYCHTVDLARACLTVLEAKPHAVAYQAFNVGGTSQNYRKRELVELILEELPQMRDRVAYVSPGDDQRNYRVSCEKIQSQVGFCITKTVPEGIREIIFAINSGLIENPDDPRYRNA